MNISPIPSKPKGLVPLHGGEARRQGFGKRHNPYPEGTGLFLLWKQDYEAEKVLQYTVAYTTDSA